MYYKQKLGVIAILEAIDRESLWYEVWEKKWKDQLKHCFVVELIIVSFDAPTWVMTEEPLKEWRIIY